jgi:hypothetical protein
MRTGTLPAGETRSTLALNEGSLNDNRSSSNGMPACLRSNHERNDHEE